MKIYKIAQSADEQAEQQYQEYQNKGDDIQEVQLKSAIKTVVLKMLKGVAVQHININGRLVNNEYVDLQIQILLSTHHSNIKGYAKRTQELMSSGAIQQAVQDRIGVYPTITVSPTPQELNLPKPKSEQETQQEIQQTKKFLAQQTKKFQKTNLIIENIVRKRLYVNNVNVIADFDFKQNKYKKLTIQLAQVDEKLKEWLIEQIRLGATHILVNKIAGIYPTIEIVN